MYKEYWSERAANDLDIIVTYLRLQWSDKVAEKFIKKTEDIIAQLRIKPTLYPVIVERQEIRRVVITQHNSLYYKITDDIIYIVTIFDTRQDIEKLKL
jgi:plasmid stabilization system protein ParE